MPVCQTPSAPSKRNVPHEVIVITEYYSSKTITITKTRSLGEAWRSVT